MGGFTDWKEASPAEFTPVPNHAFRRLHDEAVRLNVVSRLFVNAQKAAARAMLIRLQPLLDAARESGGELKLSGFRPEDLDLTDADEALAVSTTEQSLVNDLLLSFTEGPLSNNWPTDWFIAQNTRDCIEALVQPIRAMVLISSTSEGTLEFEGSNPPAEFRVFRLLQPGVADLVGDNTRVDPKM